MKKTLAMLGVLLFLSMPSFAGHEAEVTHRLCDSMQQNDGTMREKYGEAIEIVLAICSYVEQLESKLASCTGRPASLEYALWQTPVAWGRGNYLPGPENASWGNLARISAPQDAIPPGKPKTLMIYRNFPAAKVGVMEPMTPIGLEIRQEAGSRPESGEVFSCDHKMETFLIGEETKVEANRIRLTCGQSQFIITGLIF